MTQFRLDGEFRVSADVLWEAVSDFGDVSWLPGDPRFESEGRGEGMIRTIWVGDAPPVREQLNVCDEAERAIHYAVVEGNPLPVRDYRATMKVVDLGGDHSRLEWSSTWEPDRVSEVQARAAVEGVYSMVLLSMKATLEKE
jgi:hypothetical protein